MFGLLSHVCAHAMFAVKRQPRCCCSACLFVGELTFDDVNCIKAFSPRDFQRLQQLYYNVRKQGGGKRSERRNY